MTLFRMRASTLLLLALPPCLRASWPEGKVHPWHQEIRDAMDAEAGIDRAKEAAARRVVRGDIPILHEFSQKGRFGYNDVKELLEEDGCEMKRSNWLRSGHDTWCDTVLERTVDGMLPIHYACRAGFRSTAAQLLLRRGDEMINEADDRGITPLMYAGLSSNRNKDDGPHNLVALLLHEGADKTAVDNQGRNAVHHAAATGNEMAMEHLLPDMSGAEIDGRDEDGATPLHLASFNGRSRCMRMLLNAGADADAVDNDGKTALDYAKEGGWGETGKLLLAMYAAPQPCHQPPPCEAASECMQLARLSNPPIVRIKKWLVGRGLVWQAAYAQVTSR